MLVAVTLLLWMSAICCGISVLRTRGLLRRLRRLLATLVCAGLSLVLSGMLLLLHTFHAFSRETLIARVTTQRLSPQEFQLTYLPEGVDEREAVRVRLRGDQWAVSGGIVKWRRWLTMLGLSSYHKPMRLSGQFANLAQQRAHPPTVHALAPSVDRVWEACYRAAPWLPFVDAVYGSSAYVYVEPGVTQEVYVTPSGYLIKRAVLRHKDSVSY